MNKIILKLTDEQLKLYRELASKQNEHLQSEETFNEFSLKITFSEPPFTFLEFIDGTINNNVTDLGDINFEIIES